MFQDHQFIFFDESGHMNFSPKTSTHVVIVARNITNSSKRIMEKYWQLRHDLYIQPPEDTGIRGKYQNRRFHASDDPQEVRNKVFDLICKHLHLLQVQALVLDKDDVFKESRSEEWLYGKVYYYLVRTILTRSKWFEGIEGVRFLIDHTQDKRLRQATVGGIRRAEAETGAQFRSIIFHATSHAHPFLQLADYFCWAIYRKYELEDMRSYDLVDEAIENEWYLFKK